MSDFYYEARDEAGQPISGRIRAMDVRDAIRQLEANRWDVVSVRTVPKPGASPEQDAGSDHAVRSLGASSDSDLIPPDAEMPRLSKQETREIARHLSDAIQSGLPLIPGLSALARELPDSRVRQGLRTMIAQLETGRDLATVLESRRVPSDLRGLIRAGARSGKTGQVLSHYVTHTQRMHDLRRKMALAWGYPLALVVFALMIWGSAMVFLVPQFADIFGDFGTELPTSTKLMVQLSRLMTEHGLLVLAGIVGGALLIWLIFKIVFSPAQRRRIVWSLPLIGSTIHAAAMSRFCRLFGLLIENEVPMPEALRLAGEGAADAELGEAALYLADVVELGRPITGHEFACRRFPSTFVQLLAQMNGPHVQDKSVESLAEASLAMSRMFESQAGVSAARLATLCPPIVVTFVGVTFGFTVIALLFPLVKLLNDLS